MSNSASIPSKKDTAPLTDEQKAILVEQLAQEVEDYIASIGL